MGHPRSYDGGHPKRLTVLFILCWSTPKTVDFNLKPKNLNFGFSDGMTRCFLKFDRNQALQYQLQMVTELLKLNTNILQEMQQQQTDMKNMRSMLVSCPDTWKPLLKILKPVSKEADDEKRVAFQQKIVQFLKTKFTAISLMIEDVKSPQVQTTTFCPVKIAGTG